MTDERIAHWRAYASNFAKKLKGRGAPFTQEDLEDAEMEGLLKALELEHDPRCQDVWCPKEEKMKPSPFIATSVGNVVKNIADRLNTRARDVNWEDHEKKV